jgi:hypothetical protein
MCWQGSFYIFNQAPSFNLKQIIQQHIKGKKLAFFFKWASNISFLPLKKFNIFLTPKPGMSMSWKPTLSRPRQAHPHHCGHVMHGQVIHDHVMQLLALSPSPPCQDSLNWHSCHRDIAVVAAWVPPQNAVAARSKKTATWALSIVQTQQSNKNLVMRYGYTCGRYLMTWMTSMAEDELRTWMTPNRRMDESGQGPKRARAIPPYAWTSQAGDYREPEL